MLLLVHEHAAHTATAAALRERGISQTKSYGPFLCGRRMRMGGCCPRLARPLAGRGDRPDWMDGGSARAFLRSFQSELVVRTDGAVHLRPSVRPLLLSL